MKKLALALFFLFLAMPAAQAADCMPCLKLRQGQRLTGQFVHEHPLEGMAQPLRTQGRFIVESDGQVVWAIEKPMQTTTVINREGLTQMVGTFVLLKVSSQQQPFLQSVQERLLWALSGRWDKMENDFTIHRQGNPSKWEVNITPKTEMDQRKIFRSVTATGGPFVEQARILLPSGITDTIQFSEMAVRD